MVSDPILPSLIRPFAKDIAAEAKAQFPLPREITELVNGIIRAWEQRGKQSDSFSYSHQEPPKVSQSSLLKELTKLAKDLKMSPAELEEAHLKHARLESRQEARSRLHDRKPDTSVLETKRQDPKINIRRLKKAQIKMAKDLGLSQAELVEALKKLSRRNKRTEKSYAGVKKPSAGGRHHKSTTAARTESQNAQANYRKIRRAQIEKARKKGISLREFERKGLRKARRESLRQAEKDKSAAPKPSIFKLDSETKDSLKSIKPKPKSSIQKPDTTVSRPSREKASPHFRLDTTDSSSMRTRHALTSLHEFRRLPIGTHLSTEQLFGPNLTKVKIQQNNGYTCSRLALIDNILHHPKAKQVLDSIKIRTAPNGLTVRFPGQEESVHVTYDMLNQAETCTSRFKGPAIYEQALGHYYGTDWKEPPDIAELLIPNHLLKDTDPISYSPISKEPRCGLPPAEYEARLKELIREAHANPASMPFMGARENRNHILSPRFLESTEDSIVLFDPLYHPQIRRIPITKFVKKYELIELGSKEPDVIFSLRNRLYDDPIDGLTCELNYLHEAGNMNRLSEILIADPQLCATLRRAAPEQVKALRRRFRDAGNFPPL